LYQQNEIITQKTHTMKTPIELLQYGQLIIFKGITYQVATSKPLHTSFETKLFVKRMTDNGIKHEMITFPLNTKIYAV